VFFLLISEKTVRQAIIARDKQIVEENIPLYKELGITPAMFDYRRDNWEYWLAKETSLTLTRAQRQELADAIVAVARLRASMATNRSYGYSYTSTSRLTPAQVAILDTVGLTPYQLGISNAETWENYSCAT
jgi:hypothetical protein